MQIAALLEEIVDEVKQVEGVKAIVLGGSRARGTHTSTSDVDLGIYYHSNSPLDLIALSKVATQRTSELGDIGQVVEEVNAAGTDWWEDDRFVLFYLPYVSVCLPGDPPLCGTYITYNMIIDAFRLLRP